MATGGLVLALLAGGCMTRFDPPYGYADHDGSVSRGTARPVTMPPNAPSIISGFDVLPAGQVETPEDRLHEGIDVFAREGTPVLAPARGVVTGSYWEPFNGNNIVLDNGVGPDGLFVRTRFKHLQQRTVRAGDRVVRGQQIGTLGRTGLQAGGILHLHYELRVGASRDQLYFRALNPNEFWYDGAGIVTCFDEDREFSDEPFRTTYPVRCADSIE